MAPGHPPGSGGERALVASVPLFAAASAHYKSASNPNAPRLIALDEAFAGVDDDSRAKCLGLLATFDMDVAMTSEREWGCHPEVPGSASASLRGRTAFDAVLVTPWRWDGREWRPMGRRMTEIDPKLHRLLGGEPVAWLVRWARDRLEAGVPDGTVTSAAATSAQRRAAERLTGRRSPFRGVAVVGVVDGGLTDPAQQRAAQGGPAEAVTRLTGPLRDRNRERAVLAAAWASVFTSLDAAVETAVSELAPWRAWLDVTGCCATSPPTDQARLLLAQVARGSPARTLARRPPRPPRRRCAAMLTLLGRGNAPVGTLAPRLRRPALACLPFAAEVTAGSCRAAWAAEPGSPRRAIVAGARLGLAGDPHTALGQVARRHAAKLGSGGAHVRQSAAMTSRCTPAACGYARPRWWSRPC